MVRKTIYFTLLFLTSCGPMPDDIAKQKVQDKVSYDLIDPSSAQFRNVAVVGGWVCGEVNAKNRFGAYVGFKPFYGAYIDGAEAIGHIYDSEDNVSEAVYGPIYSANCDDAGNPRSDEDRLNAMQKSGTTK
jgi:hypothetical protein